MDNLCEMLSPFQSKQYANTYVFIVCKGYKIYIRSRNVYFHVNSHERCLLNVGRKEIRIKGEIANVDILDIITKLEIDQILEERIYVRCVN